MLQMHVRMECIEWSRRKYRVESKHQWMITSLPSNAESSQVGHLPRSCLAITLLSVSWSQLVVLSLVFRRCMQQLQEQSRHLAVSHDCP